MSQKQFNDVMYAASVIIAVLAFASLTVFKNRLWGELSFAFLMFMIFERHASHKAEIGELKDEIKTLKRMLKQRKLSLEIQHERSFEGGDEFRLFLETEIETLRRFLSEDD